MRYQKFIFVFFSVCFFCAGAYAAKQEMKFRKIDFNVRQVNPEKTTISGLDRGQLVALGTSKTWGVITADFESLPKWADDVELKYFVLFSTKRDKNPVMLAGSVTYMDVEQGRGHISYMYIPPQVLRRYGEVLRIRSEIWYNGIMQDSMQWPKAKKDSKTPWWTRVKPINGAIMNRYFTPFEHEQQMSEELIKI